MWIPGAPTAPIILSTTRPDLNMINVGMDWTPNLVAIPWLASTFTLANLTFGYFLSRLSKTGCIILHGPHHSALKHDLYVQIRVGFSPDTTWSKLESFKSVTPGSKKSI